MSARYYNFREGDRSELLADYLLSGIGISTPVRRQDDTGFDFYCNVSDNEKGILTFGSPYIIQIKSDSISEVSFGTSIQNDWAPHKVEWLYRLELPLFFGFINKSKVELKIYDCSFFNFYKFFYYDNVLPAKIIFQINGLKEITQSSISSNLNTTIIGNWQNIKYDNYECLGQEITIPMGEPIITISNSDFEDTDLLKKKKSLLKKAIEVNLSSIRFFKQQAGVVEFINSNTTNQSMAFGNMHFTSKNEEIIPILLNSIDKQLNCLYGNAIHFKYTELKEILDRFKKLK